MEDTLEPFVLESGADGEGSAGGTESRTPLTAVEGGESEDEMSTSIMSSGESRIAESTSISVMCWRCCDTSDGFHCSSSTSLADRDIRS